MRALLGAEVTTPTGSTSPGSGGDDCARSSWALPLSVVDAATRT